MKVDGLKLPQLSCPLFTHIVHIIKVVLLHCLYFPGGNQSLKDMKVDCLKLPPLSGPLLTYVVCIIEVLLYISCVF